MYKHKNNNHVKVKLPFFMLQVMETVRHGKEAVKLFNLLPIPVYFAIQFFRTAKYLMYILAIYRWRGE